jgi:hypothetical protein
MRNILHICLVTLKLVHNLDDCSCVSLSAYLESYFFHNKEQRLAGSISVIMFMFMF